MVWYGFFCYYILNIHINTSFFSRDSDLTSSFWDVDILKLGCGYTKQRCGYTQKDVDILLIKLILKMWIYYVKDVDILPILEKRI